MDWCIRDWILIWIAAVISLLVLVIIFGMYMLNRNISSMTQTVQRPLNAVGQMVSSVANRATDSFNRIPDGQIDTLRDNIHGMVGHAHKMVTSVEPATLNNMINASCNSIKR